MKFIGKDFLWNDNTKQCDIEVPIVVEAQSAYIHEDICAKKENKEERYEIRLDAYISSIAWKIVKTKIVDGYHVLLTLDEARMIVQKCQAADIIELDEAFHLGREYNDVAVRVSQFNDDKYYNPEYEHCDEIPIKVEIVEKKK